MSGATPAHSFVGSSASRFACTLSLLDVARRNRDMLAGIAG
jgi:hypothetical protein